jgi:hypothetical protein
MKIAAMRAFGAEVDLVPSPPGGLWPDLWPQLIELAKLVADQVEGFATDQFRGPAPGAGVVVHVVQVGQRRGSCAEVVHDCVLGPGEGGSEHVGRAGRG